MTHVSQLEQRIRDLEGELEAVQASKDKYQDLYDNSPELLASVDAKTGQITECNVGFLEALGYAKTDVIGRRILEFHHPNTQARAEEIFRTFKKTGEVHDAELQLLRKDGSPLDISLNVSAAYDADGNVEYSRSACREITERKRFESRLRQSQELYRGLVDTSQDLIWRSDSVGRFTFLNPAWEALLGYAREEMLGNSLSAFQSRETGDRDGDVFRTCADSESIVGYETTCTTKGGVEIHLEINAVPLRNEQGEVAGAQGTARDITGRRRLDEERVQNEVRMQQAQRLESLGVLAGGIAHDFNNLLVGVLGNADLALQEVGPDSRAAEDLRLVKSAATRASELCRQLLAYAGKGRFLIEKVDLSSLVEEMGGLMKVAIGREVILDFTLAKQLPPIEAEATQIRQIVMNLITNASEAIGDRSGIVTVATDTMICDSRYLRELLGGEELEPGPYVSLEVSDNGCGMDEVTRERLFEPFFTSKSKGRGMGLAAVRGIVRGHSGAIRVYSEIDRGTTVKLLFPAASGLADVLTATPEKSEQWRGSGTVLVVDDDETVRSVVTRMLDRMGFDVLIAQDGEEGIAEYRAHLDEIVMVLLDMTMPRMSGEATFRQLRQINPEATILLCSGHNEQEAVRSFVGRGLAGFVQKPFSWDMLRDKIRKVLETSRA